jgi:thymidylate synthase (FAD)
MRSTDLEILEALYLHYLNRLDQGLDEEHARSIMPYDIRQNFVVSFNPRSLMHFLDLRHKPDAQLEIQWLAEDLFSWFCSWMPEIAAWYAKNRLGKGKLAP